MRYRVFSLVQGILKGEVSLYRWPPVCWFGISCMTTDNCCFYLQNRQIQTSKTGGQWYSDTSSFSIQCLVQYLQERPELQLGWLYCSPPDNCYTDFFVFRHRYRIMSPKFLKFERVSNSSLKFWKRQKRKWEITTASKTKWNLHSKSTVSYFHLNQIFVSKSKAGAYLYGFHSKDRLIALPSIIRTLLKWLTVTNTPAYYGMNYQWKNVFRTGPRYHCLQSLANVIKLFTVESYKFS